MAHGSMQVSSLLHHRRILSSDVSVKSKSGVLSVGTAGCVETAQVMRNAHNRTYYSSLVQVSLHMHLLYLCSVAVLSLLATQQDCSMPQAAGSLRCSWH